MYYLSEIEQTVYNNINNQPLISCARIAESVKRPPVIPYYEAFTFPLLSSYFGLTEQRLRNAYKAHRYLFEDDCAQVSGKEMRHYSENAKSLGKHYGYLCEFSNGVVAQITNSINLIFNYRALLRFAAYLCNESEVAEEIYKVLKGNERKTVGISNKRVPWFAKFDGVVEQKEIKLPMECPYVEAAEATKNKPHTTRNVALKVNQLDENGNTLYVWNSASEAATVLGINKGLIYKCLQGKHKTAGNGKYRFAYAN